MHWQARLQNYQKTFPKFPMAMGTAGSKVFGVWEIGNNYGVTSGYYGGYPATYLKRIKALFPEKQNVLHLFSGRVDTKTMPGDTVDLDPGADPTFLDDAQTLKNVPLENYDLVCCDPPYSIEDAEHYMPSMVSRTKVFRALQRCVAGTHVVWLDQVSPQYSKQLWQPQGIIGVSISTNHRYRCVRFYERKGLVGDLAASVEDL